jgi:thermitase
VKPAFESFVVRLEPRSSSAAAAGKRLTVALPGQWVVRPLAPQLGEYELVPATRRRLAIGAAWELARELRARPDIEFAEPLFAYAGLEPDPQHLEDYLAPHEMPVTRARSIGDDDDKACARSDFQWSLKNANVLSAWKLPPPPGGAPFGGDIVIGHPDTGYSLHPDVWGTDGAQVRVASGFDFVDEDPNALDPLESDAAGHGTSTASVIMSPTGAAGVREVSGVAPRASIVPLRVSTSVVHFSFARLTRAIYHAVDVAKVDVLSMSLGGPSPSEALERALLYAIERGVIPLAAAGNVWPFVVYPAKYSHVFAVAASNCLDQKWSGSASGSAVDATAPGESVWRAAADLKNGNPRYKVAMSSGTSYAVATTAGACALWLAFHGKPALAQLYGSAGLARAFRRVLKSSGVRTPNDWPTDRMGAGILDAVKLLSAPLPVTTAGVRSAAPVGTVERALDYFPDDDPDRVMHALTASVPTERTTKSRAVRRAMDDVGDELLFQLATDPALRARVHEQATGAGTRSIGKPPRSDASQRCKALFGL